MEPVVQNLCKSFKHTKLQTVTYTQKMFQTYKVTSCDTQLQKTTSGIKCKLHAGKG